MKVLIVDDESDVAEIIGFLVHDLFPKNTQILIAHSGKSANKFLLEDKTIDVCLCDHSMPGGMGTEVIKCIIDNDLKTKFVLCSTINPGENSTDYPSNYLFSVIQKPDIGHGLENLIKLIERSDKEKNPAPEFIPISIHVLALMGKTPADVYIRMSDNKYIKCLKKYEVFTEADKFKYYAKSIDELFIKKGDHKPSINTDIFDTVQKLIERRNLPLQDKMSIAHTQLVGLIKFTGMTHELAEVSKKNIQQSVSLIMKSSTLSDFWKEMNLLGDYPSKLYTLHSMLVSVIIKKSHWNSEGTMFKLTLSSFLQDVSLDSISLMEIADYKEFLEKKHLFTPAEIKKYNEHPQKAVEIVSYYKDIPPDIDRILLEQHEMPDGSGFPRKLNANQVGPLSCMFIISGIFARHVLKEGNQFNLGSFIEYLEKRGYSRGNFKETFDAIKSMKDEAQK